MASQPERAFARQVRPRRGPASAVHHVGEAGLCGWEMIWRDKAQAHHRCRGRGWGSTSA